MGSENPHAIDSDMSGIFDDPTFSNLQYENYGDSPFDANHLFDFGSSVNADSPNFATSRTILKSEPDVEIGKLAQQQHQPSHTRSVISSRSAGSSSQDSSSETSTRRKRKTTSESPPTANLANLKVEGLSIKPEDTIMNSNNNPLYQNFGTPMNAQSLEQDFSNTFDFESAASSPGGVDQSGLQYSQAALNRAIQRSQNALPHGTVKPSDFFLASNTASPTSTKATRTADASPGAMFNTTPSSATAETFAPNQMWANGTQNPAWTTDYTNSYSPGALGLTPSPVTNEVSNYGQGAIPTEENRIPLSIGPIPAKSRVETQINIRMTMDRLPPGVKNLHLPTHTIAKAKLLAKDPVPSEDTLELHCMLVCTSAMSQPHLREKALRNAAQQDNVEIQARGQSASGKKEEEKVDEDDKPANGGEVRICLNCINRERKRAARKKLKKEEEQAHWEKYETERVIVFNTNEHKPWQEWQQSPPPKETGAQNNELYPPSETAMQVTAPMRIACYCRHQNEKDGFQVIFTIKDHLGRVVAQQMSDSILITDDHKTHPLATMPGQVWYDGNFVPPGPFASQSMVDLHSHMPTMSMSKSTGNLHGMAFGAQPFHTGSSMHQIPYSQTTSATMTPRNLSRPASPTGLPGSGPNKKRKSSSAHRRVPSGLAMTRVDTSQPMASANASAISNASPFSPTQAPFTGVDSNHPSYITLPHSGNRAQYHTNPPTPSEGPSFPYGALSRNASLDGSNFQTFYSLPNSAHQSRAPSPVQMQSGPNFAAFQRQQAHGGASNMPIRSHPFAVSQNPAANQPPAEPERPTPIINKVIPAEGPTSGGIEVSIYGSGFAPGMEVMFGDRIATATTFWGEKALCCVIPPGQAGAVPVVIAPSQMRQYPSPTAGQAQVFRYKGDSTDMRLMELALRYYSDQETGNPEQWQTLARHAANAYVTQGQQVQQQQGPPRGAFQGQQHPGGYQNMEQGQGYP